MYRHVAQSLIVNQGNMGQLVECGDFVNQTDMKNTKNKHDNQKKITNKS